MHDGRPEVARSLSGPSSLNSEAIINWAGYVKGGRSLHCNAALINASTCVVREKNKRQPKLYARLLTRGRTELAPHTNGGNARAGRRPATPARAHPASLLPDTFNLKLTTRLLFVQRDGRPTRTAKTRERHAHAACATPPPPPPPPPM
ncbi:hypothetical protein EVAR_78496_1 [Eumeta japonica]|uniref:Uncharacterized protein n=1 Tax=Eumeta variegata TaxID=151549 RepID=A0A4C1TYD4_EUMVA|nr:hypothetical protein EVAR_78496_1 [Eumeta japonica]